MLYEVITLRIPIFLYLFPLFGVDLFGRALHQRVELRARVAGHVGRVVGLQDAQQGMRVIVIRAPARAEHSYNFV